MKIVNFFIIVAIASILILFLINDNKYLIDIKYRIEPVKFKSGNYLLKGSLYIPENIYSKRVIIISHGFNMLGARHFLYKEMSERFAVKGYNVLSFDYRGFGKSEGPFEVKEAVDLDFVGDAKAAIAFAKKKFNGNLDYIIIGHSFGAGVGMKVGIEDSTINKIICISPGRRAMELYFNEKPSIGVEWIASRIKEEMAIKLPIKHELISEIFLPITIDSLKNIFMPEDCILKDKIELLNLNKICENKIFLVKCNKISNPKLENEINSLNPFDNLNILKTYHEFRKFYYIMIPFFLLLQIMVKY